MKVTFNLDSGANIHSCKSQSWNLLLEKDAKSFGFTKDEWRSLDDSEKDEVVHEWAMNYVEIYYEEENPRQEATSE